jgi:ubiquinone biosynthesis protein Coq4
VAFFNQLIAALKDLAALAAVARSGGDLKAIADLVDRLIASPQMAECLRRCREEAGGAAMIDGRYPPLQPDMASLRAMPKGSLGHSYAELMLSRGYDPEFFRPRPLSSDAHWLTQRIATTHDIHHVVSGFGTTPEGESGVLAITATQIGFPAYVMLNNAAQVSRFRFKTKGYALMGRAIAHGNSIGFSAQPLWMARWEEGWDWPVEQWRERLGITKPATSEPYGLQPLPGSTIQVLQSP